MESIRIIYGIKYKQLLIDDCIGVYFISQKGDVFSAFSNRNLKHCIQKNNNIHVFKVWIADKKQTKNISIARAVLTAWKKNPNPKIYKYAIHLDGDFNNLNVSNLEWGSAAISCLRKWDRYPELREKIKGNIHPHNERMTSKMIEQLIQYREIGYSCRELADIFPVGKSQICNILKKNKINILKCVGKNN